VLNWGLSRESERWAERGNFKRIKSSAHDERIVWHISFFEIQEVGF
jgi:hypothetical protein